MSVSQNNIDEAIRFHQSGDLNRAGQCYRKILKKCPDDFDALHMLGVLNYQKGKFDKAIVLLEKAKKQNTTAEVLTNLGTVFITKGDLNKAVDVFKHALKINPKLALTHYNLGNTYKKLNDYTKAIASYRSAIELNPNYYDALHNIAIVYKIKDMFKEAEQAGLKAISINPNNSESQFTLAGVLLRLGKKEAAIKAYMKTLEIDPGHTTAKHLISSLLGETTQRPPDEYIADLFNDFAETFDDHLVNKLKYRTPKIIHDTVISHIDTKQTYSILDLGCGTGLCGKLLTDYADNLVGVDLSSKMIEKARQLKVYDEFNVVDIESYFNLSSKVFDIILSADVFVYVGDLESTFKQCKNAMSEKGVFIFSVEEYKGEGYKLLDTGRYAHSIEYIRKMVDAVGFREIECKSLVLREQAGKPIDGCVFLLKI